MTTAAIFAGEAIHIRMSWISLVQSTRRDSLKSSGEDSHRTVKVTRRPFDALLVVAALANGVLAQSPYVPPPESTSLLKDIPFVSAQVTGERFIARFKECDQHNTCEGTALKLRDTSIERNVLYFIFPDSAKTIADGLTPNNVNERLAAEGPKELAALKKSHE